MYVCDICDNMCKIQCNTEEHRLNVFCGAKGVDILIRGAYLIIAPHAAVWGSAPRRRVTAGGHRLLPQPELCSPPGGTRSWRGARSRRAEARLAGALVARFARSHTVLERSPVKLSSWRTIWFSCMCMPLPAQEMASIKANAVLRVRNGPGDGTLPVLSPHGMPM